MAEQNFFQRLFNRQPVEQKNSNMMGYFGVGTDEAKTYKYADLAKEGYLKNAIVYRCVNEISKGGYIIFEVDSEPDILIIATGSEVSLGVAVAETFSKRGVSIQVVSMPCVEIFDSQPRAYRDRVLPPNVTKRVAIEAAHTYFWHKYIGPEGVIVGMDSFGASGPGEQPAFCHFTNVQ